MSYDNIETPEELLSYMDKNIHYGVYDYQNNKAYCGDNENFESKSREICPAYY